MAEQTMKSSGTSASAKTGMTTSLVWGIGGLILGVLLGMLLPGFGIQSREAGRTPGDEEIRAAAQELFPEFYGTAGAEGLEGAAEPVAAQGSVAEVRGDRIVITQTGIPTLLRLIEDIPELQEVTLSEGAVLIRQTQKYEAVYAQEVAAYEQAALAYEAQFAASPEGAELPAVPDYPEFYIEEPIELSALQPGDMVTVYTQPAARTAASFAATRVEVTVSPDTGTTEMQAAP
jgi:hypothetical protein